MQHSKQQLKLKDLRIFRFMFLAVVLSFSLCTFSFSYASIQDEITDRQRQIEEIQRQIEEYQGQIEQTQSTSRTLENAIRGLNAKINQLTLEIKGLELSIGQTALEIRDTENQIGEANDKILKHKGALGEYLRIVYESDQKTLTEILFNHANISEFFGDLNSLRTNQDNLQITIKNIRELKEGLELHQSDLEEKKTDLERLKNIQNSEKKNLGGVKIQKDKVLKETKGQEAQFQKLIQKSIKDIGAIRSQITYLQQHGVTAEEAIKFGQLAAIATGIRPAFLIAILEVESGLGRNVGTGNWLDDMYQCYLRLRKPSRAETEKAAFFEIINKLGLDPVTVKVSREPNYGCGGALGPAQFLPSTWLAYEEETTRLTGHNPPNPWNIEDAFMASAIKLARGGATSKDKTGETRAAKAYISGKPTCTSRICNYYSNAVLRKAAEIEKNL